MPKAREVLRLKYEVQLSLREIAQACNCGKSTVSEILCRAEKVGITSPYIFVAVLPAIAFPFAYAYGDTKTANWIDAHVRAFEYFRGVPRIIIPDNTKTAVIKSDRVDPVLNKSYNEMARHYRTTIVPARAGKPKDYSEVFVIPNI